MKRNTLPGVNTVSKILADGARQIYYYHRASGIRLKGEPRTVEFALSFADAERTAPKANAGTFSSLIYSYSTSDNFDRRAESTKKEYRRMLKKIEDKFGTVPLAVIEDDRFAGDLLDWHDEMARDKPREADNRLTLVATVLKFSKKRHKIRSNCMKEGFERAWRGDRSDITWDDLHIEKFIAVASREVSQTVLLALYTGLRQGDCLRLPWSAYDGHCITTKVSKTSRLGSTPRTVEIPVHSDLKEMLDAMPMRSPVILTNTRGKPWTQDGFQSSEKKARTRAGITDVRFNDLRGTAITRLSEAGATLQEIATITGHSLKTVSTILDKYLHRRRSLGEAAIHKLENATGTRFANRLQTARLSVPKGGAK